jgi:large subunit ribosomal protein L19
MNVMDQIRNEGLKSEIPEFEIGDTVKVYVRVVEGEKTRNQIFEGVVIDEKGSAIDRAFTVRKLTQGVAVERVFPLHSPNVQKLEVVKKGRVRRARLNYLRGRTGKAARIAERRTAKPTKKG